MEGRMNSKEKKIINTCIICAAGMYDNGKLRGYDMTQVAQYAMIKVKKNLHHFFHVFSFVFEE